MNKAPTQSPPSAAPVSNRDGDTPADDHRDLAALAGLLDNRFRIPGTGIRFGLDGLLGLIPGVGDAATTLLSGYLIAKAHSHGAPKHLLVRMAANAGIDFVVGAIPLAGDLFDFAWKANLKNVELLRDHLDKKSRE